MPIYFRFVGVASVCLLFIACGDQENSLTAEEAGRALMSLRQALPTGDLTGEHHQCRDGGEVHIKSRAAAGSKATLSATLTKCKSGGIHASGDYHVQYPDITMGQSAEEVGSMGILKEHSRGKISFGGDISGTCDVDLQVATSLFPPSKSTYGGKFCGHEAAKLPLPNTN